MSISTLIQHDAGVRRLARRFPVSTFLVVSLTLWAMVSTLVALAEYRVIPGRDVLLVAHDDMEEVASFLGVVILLGTATGVTALVDGRDGVRRLLVRSCRWRVPVAWWLVAVLALPLTTIAVAVLLGVEARMPSVDSLLAELMATLVGLLLINLWEETAWAGFMQTRLSERHGLVVAAAVTGVPFALFHLPVRVISHEATTAGDLVAGFVVLTLFLVVFRTLLGTVLRGTSSVLLVAVTHTFFNRSNNSDGIAADVLVGDQGQGAALLATVLVAAVVLGWQTIFRRHPWGRQNQRASEEQ